TLADWHEDLRTLYVACTRPEDYLILSGALPEPVKPVNTAIAVLMERFDLVTGQCLDASIPVDERPGVRVHAPDEPTEDGRLARSQDGPPTPLSAADAAAAIPAPMRRPAGAVVLLAALEAAALRSAGGLFDGDDADVALAEPPSGPRERLLRAVL